MCVRKTLLQQLAHRGEIRDLFLSNDCAKQQNLSLVSAEEKVPFFLFKLIFYTSGSSSETTTDSNVIISRSLRRSHTNNISQKPDEP